VQAVELKILDRRLREWGLPRYQTDGAAAIDLMACVDRAVLVRPDTPAELISAGIALHMADPGMAALILPRSGMGHKRGLVLGNLVGCIDSDYTGPVMVSAWNRNAPGTPPIRIEPGDRFAQMVFVPVVRPEFSVVEEFTAPSERGAGGFGSTGRR
jgi:dUTP pyrophosphatase